MNTTSDPGDTTPKPGAPPRSVILRVLGVVFVLVGLAWVRSFADVVAADTLHTFEGARTGAYALTYLVAGVAMFLHLRWAALAAAAWGIVAFSQLFYPPIPRDQVPLLAQIALALLCLLWMLGLVFYVNRRTRMMTHDGPA